MWQVPRTAQSWQGSYEETRRFDQETVERRWEKVFLVEKGGKKGKWEKVKENFWKIVEKREKREEGKRVEKMEKGEK